MADYNVERFQNEPLCFAGRQVVAVESAPCDTGTGERHLQLVVYRCDDGGLVAQIAYQSTVANEQPVSLAERLDSVTDAENFFFAFEPEEFVQRAGVQLPPKEHRLLTSELYARYETALREVLAELAPRKESQANAVTAMELDSARGTDG